MVRSSGMNGTSPHNNSSPIVSSFLEHLRAMAGASLLMSSADLGLVGTRSPYSFAHLPAYFVVTWGSALWVAVALTACCTALELLALTFFQNRTEAVLSRGGRIFAFSLGTALVALALIKPWNLYITWPYFLLPAGALLAALTLIYAKRKLTENYFRSALLVAAFLLFLADSFLFRKLYLSIHNTLFFLAFSLVAAATFRLPSLPPQANRALVAGALATQLFLISSLPEPRVLGITHGAVGPKVLGVLHLTADLDGDGYSAVFGGGDCNDGDPRVHPGACEVEKRDLNCNGHIGLARREKSPSPETLSFPRLDSPDIYLIVVDTLRGDLGKVPRQTVAPELESFAESALDFQNAYTPYPSTFRAMISMVQSRSWRSISPTQETVLNNFARRGYDVRVSIAKERLKITKDSKLLHFQERGKNNPFQARAWSGKKVWSEEIFNDAIGELESETGPPRFRWLHSLDPHQPTTRSGQTPLQRYRSEVRHVSKHFGRLLSALEKSDRGKQAIVVFLSDHGEEFLDHGARYHGATVFQENVHVPLLIRIPGVMPKSVSAPVSLIDVFPTLFHALDFTAPAHWEGRSLLGPIPQDRSVFVQIEPVKNLSGDGRPEIHAIVRGKDKLVFNLTDNVLELYDLDQDPGERTNLIERFPKRTKTLLQRLALWQDRPICQSF